MSTKNKVQVMDHVSILDMIHIHVLQPTPGNFQVMLEPTDKTKNVVFDRKALNEMNAQITEKCREMSANDPRSKQFIEEFVARMTEALYKNGLVELVEATDPVNDPYGDLRSKNDPLDKFGRN